MEIEEIRKFNKSLLNMRLGDILSKELRSEIVRTKTIIADLFSVLRSPNGFGQLNRLAEEKLKSFAQEKEGGQ